MIQFEELINQIRSKFRYHPQEAEGREREGEEEAVAAG